MIISLVHTTLPLVDFLRSFFSKCHLLFVSLVSLKLKMVEKSIVVPTVKCKGFKLSLIVVTDMALISLCNVLMSDHKMNVAAWCIHKSWSNFAPKTQGNHMVYPSFAIVSFL